jgi:hypothetical protein
MTGAGWTGLVYLGVGLIAGGLFGWLLGREVWRRVWADRNIRWRIDKVSPLVGENLALVAENVALREFVEQQFCECENEYGEPRRDGKLCDRCYALHRADEAARKAGAE